jgi:hypothetical protein
MNVLEELRKMRASLDAAIRALEGPSVPADPDAPKKRGYTSSGTHWTQTPEGKKRMRHIQQKAWRTRRKNRRQL